MVRIPARYGLLVALFISSVGWAAGWTGNALAGAAPKLCEKEMARASAKYDVPLGMLYAVGLTETGRAGSLRPYALNMDGKAAYAETLAEALQHFREARARGIKLIDLGCMQINHYFHAENFASVEEMFDPAKNVDYAARFLKQLREREGNWTLAVARYNAGPNNNPAQKQYVCRVMTNMVATGFGRWTPDASNFCGSAYTGAARAEATAKQKLSAQTPSTRGQ